MGRFSSPLRAAVAAESSASQFITTGARTGRDDGERGVLVLLAGTFCAEAPATADPAAVVVRHDFGTTQVYFRIDIRYL